MSDETYVSPSAQVTDAELGVGAKIWHFCNLYGCRVGRDSQIGSYCEIRRGATIGDHCRLQSYILVAEDCVVEDYVFMGPGVLFTNDNSPSAVKAAESTWKLETIKVEEYVVIGAGTIVLPGVTIGARSLVGAGSLVGKDVDPYGVYYGSPARKVGDLREPPYRDRWPELLR